MATLTITVPDVVVPRIKAAFGDGSTVTTIQDWIKQLIKDKVAGMESQTQAITTAANVQKEIW